MSRSGNVWDNAALESFFSSLKTERTAHKVYRTRNQARADVFDYIERFYNPRRRHSTIGYLSPMEFERILGCSVFATRSRNTWLLFKIQPPRNGHAGQVGRQDLALTRVRYFDDSSSTAT